jgi:hypothetical protein
VCGSRTYFCKKVSLVFVYGRCRKVKTNVRRSKKRRRKKKEKKEPRAHSAEEVLISPVLFLCFFPALCTFSTATTTLVYLCFSLFNLLPLECVLLENPANRVVSDKGSVLKFVPYTLQAVKQGFQDLGASSMQTAHDLL